MLISHEREKLLNTIVYFAKNTEACGKTKILKLLYLLDFEHFKQTGRSVTGLKYYAWKMGPVPVDLYEELDHPEDDFKEHARLVSVQAGDWERKEVEPLTAFDPSHFSKRELRMMEKLAATYRESCANDMIGITHAENDAWDKVWQGGLGRNNLIPYDLAVGDEVKDDILSRAQESEEMRRNFG